MATVLCELREADAVAGLAAWCQSLWDSACGASQEWPKWIHAIQLEAKGRDEDAALQYLELFRSDDVLNVTSSAQLMHLLANRLTETYMRLGNWLAMEEWLAVLQQLRQQQKPGSQLQSAFQLRSDVNYLHALAHFDASDIPTAQAHLERLDIPSSSTVVPIGAALQHSNMRLLRAMIDSERPSSLDDVSVAEQVLVAPLCASSTMGCIREVYPYVVQLSCVSLVRASLVGDECHGAVSLDSMGTVNVAAAKAGLWTQMLRVQV